MSDLPFIMAECGRCHWIGPGHERTSTDTTLAIHCPACGAHARPWILNLSREQKDLERLQAERITACQQSLDLHRAARLAQERLRDAKETVKRYEARVLLQQANDPGDIRQGFEATRALLAAEREVAEAALRRDQVLRKEKSAR